VDTHASPSRNTRVNVRHKQASKVLVCAGLDTCVFRLISLLACTARPVPSGGAIIPPHTQSNPLPRPSRPLKPELFIYLYRVPGIDEKKTVNRGKPGGLLQFKFNLNYFRTWGTPMSLPAIDCMYCPAAIIRSIARVARSSRP
jgi:hypothetical protein